MNLFTIQTKKAFSVTFLHSWVMSELCYAT